MPVDEIQQLIARVGSSDDDGTAAARLVLIGADAVAPLLEELRGAEPDRIAPLTRAVSRIRVGGALRHLEPLARDPDYKVAPAAITAIGFSLDSDAFRVLAELLGALSGYDRAAEQDPESYIVRLEATHGLKILVGPGVFERLVEALDDRSREVQESAMRTMLLLGAKQSVADSWTSRERSS